MGCGEAQWIQRLRRKGGLRSRFRAWFFRGATKPALETTGEETQQLKSGPSFASTAYASAATSSIVSGSLTSRPSSNSLVTAAHEEAEPRFIETVQFEQTEGSSAEVIAALVATYTALVAVAVDVEKDSRKLSRFHGSRAPGVAIGAYITRLRKYFDCSEACLVLSLIYIDRIVKNHPAFSISNRSIHRLLATSLMLAAKFNDDVYYSNAYYAKVCGLTLKEINALEVEFLKLLNWKCDVSTEEYTDYLHRVLSASQARST